MCRFLIVFMCLLLSVFCTIDQYQDVAGVVVYYLVSVSREVGVCVLLSIDVKNVPIKIKKKH